MRENDTPDADVPEPTTPGAPAPARRRQFLKTLAVPPAVSALAGCSLLADDATDAIVEDLEPGDTTGYPGALRFGDRYAMEVKHGGDGTTTLVGRFHHTDRLLRYTDGGNVVKAYVVGGDGYLVTGGKCIRYPDLAAGLESVVAVTTEPASDDVSDPTLAVTGRTPIDGAEMLVLERSPGDASEDEPRMTYYVDVETRYLRRIETATAVVDYHSWNEVGPIDAPDVDCRHSG